MNLSLLPIGRNKNTKCLDTAVSNIDLGLQNEQSEQVVNLSCPLTQIHHLFTLFIL